MPRWHNSFYRILGIACRGKTHWLNGAYNTGEHTTVANLWYVIRPGNERLPSGERVLAANNNTKTQLMPCLTWCPPAADNLVNTGQKILI